MGLDQQGYLWLSNPWIVALTLVVAIGLLLWCHRSLAEAGAERPALAPARARRTPYARRASGVPGAESSCRAPVERRRRHAASRQRVA